ncbi:MAG: CpaF family protein [Candidatus Omnitrophota bacterium]|nr:CpaF family protein [Candidatus Omnitrophota bacterium]
MPSETKGIQERVKARLKMRLVDLLDGAANGLVNPSQRTILEEQLRQTFKTLPEEFKDLGLSSDDEQRFVQDVIDEAIGFGPLDRLLADPSITEIMVNGPKDVFVERNGRLARAASAFRDAHHLMTVIERLLGTVGLAVTESEPICDASLPDGTRVNVIIPPLVLNGPVVTIRTKSRTWTMDDYIKAGALSPDAAAFLRACVRAKVNLVVSGGTSTGKTTLVSILSNAIPSEERIITIENVAEMELPAREHWIRLVAKSPNLEGRGEIPLRTLVKNALRMRPDRLILGEARGGEALDVVQAMHSGHDGVMTVLHANTPHAALERLEMLMLMSGLDLPPQACRVQIASAVDLVVHLGRYADGSRRIAAITQVLGISQEGFALEDLFLFEAQGFTPEGRLRGSCRYTGATPKFLSKFRLANVEIPAWVTT